MHVALLGDSTLDNGLYTEGGPDVTAHLRRGLAPDAEVTLLAVDGALSTHVPAQVDGVPDAATHVVLSVGGNDALDQIDMLQLPASKVAEGLLQVADVLDHFDEHYRACLDAVLDLGRPTVVCTIYDGDFPDPIEARVVRTAVRLFDDVIVQAALESRCPIVDLRAVCSESEDYWNPIEPSDRGGAKIAAALARVLTSDPRMAA